MKKSHKDFVAAALSKMKYLPEDNSELLEAIAESSHQGDLDSLLDTVTNYLDKHAFAKEAEEVKNYAERERELKANDAKVDEKFFSEWREALNSHPKKYLDWLSEHYDKEVLDVFKHKLVEERLLAIEEDISGIHQLKKPKGMIGKRNKFLQILVENLSIPAEAETSPQELYWKYLVSLSNEDSLCERVLPQKYGSEYRSAFSEGFMTFNKPMFFAEEDIILCKHLFHSQCLESKNKEFSKYYSKFSMDKMPLGKELLAVQGGKTLIDVLDPIVEELQKFENYCPYDLAVSLEIPRGKYMKEVAQNIVFLFKKSKIINIGCGRVTFTYKNCRFFLTWTDVNDFEHTIYPLELLETIDELKFVNDYYKETLDSVDIETRIEGKIDIDLIGMSAMSSDRIYHRWLDQLGKSGLVYFTKIARSYVNKTRKNLLLDMFNEYKASTEHKEIPPPDAADLLIERVRRLNPNHSYLERVIQEESSSKDWGLKVYSTLVFRSYKWKDAQEFCKYHGHYANLYETDPNYTSPKFIDEFVRNLDQAIETIEGKEKIFYCFPDQFTNEVLAKSCAYLTSTGTLKSVNLFTREFEYKGRSLFISGVDANRPIILSDFCGLLDKLVESALDFTRKSNLPGNKSKSKYKKSKKGKKGKRNKGNGDQGNDIKPFKD